MSGLSQHIFTWKRAVKSGRLCSVSNPDFLRQRQRVREFFSIVTPERCPVTGEWTFTLTRAKQSRS
jgi:hypothetical protein